MIHRIWILVLENSCLQCSALFWIGKSFFLGLIGSPGLFRPWWNRRWPLEAPSCPAQMAQVSPLESVRKLLIRVTIETSSIYLKKSHNWSVIFSRAVSEWAGQCYHSCARAAKILRNRGSLLLASSQRAAKCLQVFLLDPVSYGIFLEYVACK